MRWPRPFAVHAEAADLHIALGLVFNKSAFANEERLVKFDISAKAGIGWIHLQIPRKLKAIER